MGVVPPVDKSIQQLHSFLRGELSAVETYRQALERVKGADGVARLQECRQSHQQRVELLRQRIIQLGGTPATDSGPWGAFAKLVGGSAAVFGEKAAISVLEEGEDHGLADYRRDLGDLTPESRHIIEMQILPAEQQTHRVLSSLKHTIAMRAQVTLPAP